MIKKLVSIFLCLSVLGLSLVATANIEHLETTKCQSEELSLSEVEEKEFENLLKKDFDDNQFLLSSDCSNCDPDVEDGIMNEAPIAGSYPIELGVSLSFLKSIQFLDETVFPI
ncbi:MAG: hypothetical protein CL674_11265 [Bdellovibrionaceae bacterium]|nr:hypothetical protein [Pseudobdellovibrionaceae bacterium]